MAWWTARLVLLGALSACKGAIDIFECPEVDCPAGFTCLVNRCIAAGSVPLGDTCNADAQCATGLGCSFGAFTCQRQCALVFQTTVECPTGFYCGQPRGPLDDPRTLGVCTASECAADDDCGAERVCILLADSAGACLARCEDGSRPPCS